MISVIIPVYLVEPYLARCVDSVLNQTHGDMEVLLIDDGSPDNCGRICDDYARRDQRVHVFHRENKGLSASRNVGLDYAKGDYIAFVDSDDWIEPEMIETLYRKAVETGVDVVACGVCGEYQTGTIRKQFRFQGGDALVGLIRGELGECVWNKLWKSDCFSKIRFPEGMCFEDVATAYKVFAQATAATVPGCFYHYCYRKNSISHKGDVKAILDFWIANRDRCEWCWDRVSEEGRRGLRRACAYAIAKAWIRQITFSRGERQYADSYYREMQAFVRQHFGLFGEKDWSVYLRVGVFHARSRSRISFLSAFCLGKMGVAVKSLNLRRRMKNNHLIDGFWSLNRSDVKTDKYKGVSLWK